MTDFANGALDAEQETFLLAHRIAVLATGRRDGSPQVSQVLYEYDGNDVVMSVKSYTAKWKNILRQPRVALLVHEGHKQLILYGNARPIDSDPERIQKTLRVFRKLTDNPDFEADADFVSSMNDQKRTVLCLTIEKAMMND